VKKKPQIQNREGVRRGGLMYSVLHTGQVYVGNVSEGLGIRGTQVKSSIQDIVDEVAPIKKTPYGVEGRFIRM
jgi:hypothetical protein